MKQLPTILGKQLLKDMLGTRMEDASDAYLAVAAFQRMALTSDFKTAKAALEPWLVVENRIFSKTEEERLQACFDLTKPDVLGHAVDSMMAIMGSANGALKDKLAAAVIMNELFGEKELIKDGVLTDKLMISLVEKK